MQWLEQGSDVVLEFDSGDTLPGHAAVLRMWSGVLAGALELPSGGGAGDDGAGDGSSDRDSEASSGDFSSSHRIPLPGTRVADWLTAIAWAYPVIPQPELAWHTLDSVVAIASKHEMPALLDRAGAFLRARCTELSADPGSERYAWAWLRRADQANLCDARDIAAFMAACPGMMRQAREAPELLDGLSAGTLAKLVLVLLDRQPHAAERRVGFGRGGAA